MMTTFRDECLNENWFSSLADAREKIEQVAARVGNNTSFAVFTIEEP